MAATSTWLSGSGWWSSAKKGSEADSSASDSDHAEAAVASSAAAWRRPSGGARELSTDANAYLPDGSIAPQFFSPGSLGHEAQQCKPCAFFHAQGCQTGSACKFCHLCPPREVQRRKRLRRRTAREQMALRQQQGASGLAGWYPTHSRQTSAASSWGSGTSSTWGSGSPQSTPSSPSGTTEDSSGGGAMAPRPFSSMMAPMLAMAASMLQPSAPEADQANAGSRLVLRQPDGSVWSEEKTGEDLDGIRTPESFGSPRESQTSWKPQAVGDSAVHAVGMASPYMDHAFPADASYAVMTMPACSSVHMQPQLSQYPLPPQRAAPAAAGMRQQQHLQRAMQPQPHMAPVPAYSGECCGVPYTAGFWQPGLMAPDAQQQQSHVGAAYRSGDGGGAWGGLPIERMNQWVACSRARDGHTG
eukprot:TRINITY_DN13353_c0_g1_i1.p1 TRINITY_DN13353_c0_g1~~TRINITY_DN13353_c0_g1_i1.p1  ORF type:complete len:471 (-),score=85.47 TRINITY_DN13353_c0_g1_i1:186-1430(-)